jgi:RimJ/RimL family protein N-acetyltransferase
MATRAIELRTGRLLLRGWREQDRAPFAELNGDAYTMRFFPAPLTSAESDAQARRIDEGINSRAWGLWAVEIPGSAPFIGFVGLNPVSFESHFTPAIEVGWRLHRDHWGNGYATEAARASLQFAFDELGCDEVVSFTAAINTPSRRVMERLGMRHDPADDFDHPLVAPGPIQRHVLYRSSASDWAGR